MTQELKLKVGDPIEGFTFDGRNDLYTCTGAGCEKTYVYPARALAHKALHDVAGVRPELEELEGFNIEDGKYVCNWKFLSGDVCGRKYVRVTAAERHAFFHKAVTRTEEATRGGAMLREMADDLRKGKIDLPDVINKLEMAATIVDSLLKEIETADVRALQKKADAFDKITEALSSAGALTVVIDSLSDLQKAVEAGILVEG